MRQMATPATSIFHRAPTNSTALPDSLTMSVPTTWMPAPVMSNTPWMTCIIARWPNTSGRMSTPDSRMNDHSVASARPGSLKPERLRVIAPYNPESTSTATIMAMNPSRNLDIISTMLLNEASSGSSS